MDIFAEKKMIINYKPSKFFNGELEFIDINGYTRYYSFVESLEKGKKVFFDWRIPKTGIIEGDYQIEIYENNTCIDIYNIIGNDYVYNERKKCYKKVPNVLNDLRAILYIEYLRNQNKNE